jgi:hypothetical protein
MGRELYSTAAAVLAAHRLLAVRRRPFREGDRSRLVALPQITAGPAWIAGCLEAVLPSLRPVRCPEYRAVGSLPYHHRRLPSSTVFSCSLRLAAFSLALLDPSLPTLVFCRMGRGGKRVTSWVRLCWVVSWFLSERTGSWCQKQRPPGPKRLQAPRSRIARRLQRRKDARATPPSLLITLPTPPTLHRRGRIPG